MNDDHFEYWGSNQEGGQDGNIEEYNKLVETIYDAEKLETLLTQWFLGEHAYEELHPLVDDNLLVMAFNEAGN